MVHCMIVNQQHTNRNINLMNHLIQKQIIILTRIRHLINLIMNINQLSIFLQLFTNQKLQEKQIILNQLSQRLCQSSIVINQLMLNLKDIQLIKIMEEIIINPLLQFIIIISQLIVSLNLCIKQVEWEIITMTLLHLIFYQSLDRKSDKTLTKLKNL